MTNNKEWKNLCRVGAIAALFAAILFRVEGIPSTVIDWFLLLDAKPFIGLSFLAAFDLINGLLVGVVFLGLGAALWQRSRSRVVLALSSGLMGIAISLSSNISLTMVSLTHQFTGAASEAQKNALISAGQSLLAANSPMGGLSEHRHIHQLSIDITGRIDFCQPSFANKSLFRRYWAYRGWLRPDLLSYHPFYTCAANTLDGFRRCFLDDLAHTCCQIFA
jgi:hypothetical protein